MRRGTRWDFWKERAACRRVFEAPMSAIEITLVLLALMLVTWIAAASYVSGLF